MDLLTSTDILPQKRGSPLRLPHVVSSEQRGRPRKCEPAKSLVPESGRHPPGSQMSEEIGYFQRHKILFFPSQKPPGSWCDCKTLRRRKNSVYFS